MANGKFVAYYRVSTARQGRSGLGMAAQRESVDAYLRCTPGEVIAQFEEVETGKGVKPLEKRVELNEAIELCKKHDATLLIAKLDRLARNVHFISGLMEEGVNFVATDMPNADRMMIHMIASVAEWEGKQISARTKAALAAAKERGVVLGAAGRANLKSNIDERQTAADSFAENLRPFIEGLKNQQMSQRKMVEALNGVKTPAPKGGEWRLSQLQRVIRRLGL